MTKAIVKLQEPIRHIANIRALFKQQKAKFEGFGTSKNFLNLMGSYTSAQFIKNPRLFECTLESLKEAWLFCLRLGVLPCGEFGVYFVPYWDKRKGVHVIEPQMDYRCLVALSRRGDEVRRVEVDVVYVGDKFDWQRGTDSWLHHQADKSKAQDHSDNAICYAYAIATLKDGLQQFEVMRRDEIDAVRNQVGKSDSWDKHFTAMAKKSVIRRLCKLLPRSEELALAMPYVDHELDPDSPPPPVIDVAEAFGEKTQEADYVEVVDEGTALSRGEPAAENAGDSSGSITKSDSPPPAPPKKRGRPRKNSVPEPVDQLADSHMADIKREIQESRPTRLVQQAQLFEDPREDLLRKINDLVRQCRDNHIPQKLPPEDIIDAWSLDDLEKYKISLEEKLQSE